MKLYLSSYRIPTPNDLIELIGKSPGKTKIALIPNAKDYYSNYVKNTKMKEVGDYFANLGFRNTQIVDLNDYSDAETLRNELQNYDLVWAVGGNTFCLRYAMRKSGFDQIIHESIESDIIYGGESAGALVAGTDLRETEIADNPDFAPEIIWEGLNLTPQFVLPHYNGADYYDAMRHIEATRTSEIPIVKLTDAQALVINDDSQRLSTVKPDELTLITGNANKLAEYRRLLGDTLLSHELDLTEIQSTDVTEVALEKARTAYTILRKPVIVDDAGLIIDAWGKLPGALIKYFMHEVGNRGILKMLQDFDNRAAKFVTAIGYCDANGPRVFASTLPGIIAETPRGDNGFGYDTIFVPDGQTRTFAEMSAHEKDLIATRATTAKKLLEYLRSVKKSSL